MTETTTVAVAAPLSGPGAVLGRELVQAAELALGDWRAGTAGPPSVRLESVDDAGTRDVGLTVARSLAARPEVVGVVGHYNSDVTLAAAPVYDGAGVPLVAPIVSNPALTDRPTGSVFRFTNRDDRTAAALAAHLYHELGKRRAVVVETLTTYGSSMATELLRAFERLGGETVLRLSVAEGSDPAPELAGVFDLDFDVLAYGGTFEGAAILREMRRAGRGELFAAGDGCWDRVNFLDPAGPAAEDGEGVLVLSATPQAGQVPGSEDVVAAYAERFGRPNNYALNSYDSTRLLLDAVAAATRSGPGRTPPARADVVSCLRAVRYDGVACPDTCTWDESGDNRAAVTALHTAHRGGFRQVALYDRELGPRGGDAGL